jgi:hypothetical protein
MGWVASAALFLTSFLPDSTNGIIIKQIHFSDLTDLPLPPRMTKEDAIITLTSNRATGGNYEEKMESTMRELMTTERVIPTIAPLPQTDSTQETDPYVYGWREVLPTLPFGAQVWERVPLTLEDILHPQEGDFRVHSDECQHFYNCLYDIFNRPSLKRYRVA